jgi:hypothetical protein
VRVLGSRIGIVDEFFVQHVAGRDPAKTHSRGQDLTKSARKLT